jgi:negative regulator of flagellin synthesis FlgM
MRIDAYSQVQQVYQPPKAVQAQKQSAQHSADQFRLSDVAKDYQSAKAAAKNVPDIREDLIAPIKAKIQNGTYEINAEKLAEKLIGKYEEMQVMSWQA